MTVAFYAMTVAIVYTRSIYLLIFSLWQDQISAEFLRSFRYKEQFPFQSCSYRVLQVQVRFDYLSGLAATHALILFILMLYRLDIGNIRDEKYFFTEFSPYSTFRKVVFSLRAIFNERSLPYISSLKLIIPFLSTQAVQ